MNTDEEGTPETAVADVLPEETSANDKSVYIRCITCQNSFSGKYCNECGEKVVHPEDKALIGFFGSVFNALTFIDNRFIRTLRAMLFHTGKFSEDIIAGRTVPYIKPVSFFFIANLFYFLFPAADTYNSSLNTQMYSLPHSSVVREIVNEKIQKEGVSLADFRIRYDQQSTNLAKMFLITFVLFVSVFISLVNFNSEKFFVDHIVVGLEYNSIFILLGNVLFPWTVIFLNFLLVSIFDYQFQLFLNERFFDTVLGLISLGLFFRMERIVYKQRPFAALFKSLLMIPGLLISVMLYRALLFFLTMATV